MGSKAKSFQDSLKNIDIEDLQYVETDLCFYQLVSLGFLLYGDDRTRSQFILQRLIILAQHPPTGKGLTAGVTSLATSDVLRNYAKLNPQNWKLHIVEALAIIKAKRVLRRLGLSWLEIYHQFLPHVAEISVHIHPLLKALYVLAERLTPDQANQLIHYINTKYQTDTQHLRFYDCSYLEVFLLNWLNKRIIALGDRQLKGCNIQLLIEYFKFNDMAGIKDLLIETINQNLKNPETDNVALVNNNDSQDSGVYMSQQMVDSNRTLPTVDNKETVVHQPLAQQSDFDSTERYSITRKNPGFILIINQSSFYKETDPKYRHLVPFMHDAIPKRNGTNVDRDKLKELFSSFGYIPLLYENLTHLEILHQIRETVKRSLLKDSIIICILSHGMEGVVFGSNSVPVAITEIKEILTNDTLKGKPKILIIQACQRNIATVDTKSSSSIRNFSPDAYADILLAMSSMPGTDAMRHTEHGSWFVDALCKFIQKYGDVKHMMDILTTVIRDISKRKGDANQVMLPSTISTLRKDLYLPSRK
ncbi:Caspase-8 [Lucilia cuprina]|nr:Caspase-8 [Lucilia cuprina]KAI8120581.1 Caspase-8 [Lucilia cuprina]